MTTHELQQEILRLKKEKNVCILAHAYQSQAVLEVADYTGDSYGLSVQAAKTDAAGVIMCGVRFMAETCKILSPEKTVWLANPMAGCPMAEQLDLPALRALKAQYPGYATVAYINTTSALKTECDVCVTSSSAVNICRALDADKILFIPDPNLGSYVAAQLPEKQFAFYHGGCPRHMVVSAADVARRAPRTRPRSCLSTPSAALRSWRRPTMSAQRPASWRMRKNPPRGSSSSAPRTASWSISPSTARTRASTRWPCS